MTDTALRYRLLADGVLLVHVLIVLFVVGGLLVILLGAWRRWRWVHNLWFRILHLAAIAVVVVQAWLGVVCPLTALEMALRRRAGDGVYEGSFIAHWLHAFLYYDAPASVFAVVYTVFGLLVAGSWIGVPPGKYR